MPSRRRKSKELMVHCSWQATKNPQSGLHADFQIAMGAHKDVLFDQQTNEKEREEKDQQQGEDEVGRAFIFPRPFPTTPSVGPKTLMSDDHRVGIKLALRFGPAFQPV